MPSLDDLIVQLSGVRVNQRDRGRVANVAGHLLESVLKDQWHSLADHQKQRLIIASASRLRDSYTAKLKYFGQSTKEAAKESIAEEIVVLKEILNLK